MEDGPPKAPEDWRTPRRSAHSVVSVNAPASWSAAALRRFSPDHRQRGIFQRQNAECRSWTGFRVFASAFRFHNSSFPPHGAGGVGAGVGCKLFCHDLLAADDTRQCAQRVVHGCGVGKKPGHVRLQHHHVRAALVASEMLAPHAGGKIIFRLHFFNC